MPDITMSKVPTPHKQPYDIRIGVKVPELPVSFDITSQIVVIAATKDALTYTKPILETTEDDIVKINILTDIVNTEHKAAFWLEQEDIDSFSWQYRILNVNDSSISDTLAAKYDKAIENLIHMDFVDEFDAIDPKGQFKIIQPDDDAVWVAI